MSKLPVGEAIKEIKRIYDKKPYDWRVLTGRDRFGHTDLFLSQSLSLWQLKMEAINPYELVGFGSRIGKIDEDIQSKTMEIGSRSIFELISPQKNGVIITKGLQIVSNDSINNLKNELSEKQAKLDVELRKELEILLQRRYAQMKIYV